MRSSTWEEQRKKFGRAINSWLGWIPSMECNHWWGITKVLALGFLADGQTVTTTIMAPANICWAGCRTVTHSANHYRWLLPLVTNHNPPLGNCMHTFSGHMVLSALESAMKPKPIATETSHVNQDWPQYWFRGGHDDQSESMIRLSPWNDIKVEAFVSHLAEEM